jgi:hypothetical protein
MEVEAMHYTSTTPFTPDLDHVILVLGIQRFAGYVGPAMQGVPVSEWGLTEHEIARIAAGPHGSVGVYLVDSQYAGFDTSEWVVFCECGHTSGHRLLSQAQAAHDDHANVVRAPRIHTADMLES